MAWNARAPMFLRGLPQPVRCHQLRRHASAQQPAFPSRRSRAMASTSSAAGSYSLPSEGELRDLVDDAVVWAAQHGLVRAPERLPPTQHAHRRPALSAQQRVQCAPAQVVALSQQGAPEKATIHAPLATLPVAFPRERFLQAKAVQTLFNTLVDAVARDEPYLEETLRAAGQ